MRAFDFSQLIASYGYWAVFVIVALESMGVPIPGETALVSAAVYAGTTQDLGVLQVILAATAGAILGDNIGFWVGRRFGLRLLLRHGHRMGLDERRLKLGQYLFRRYGGKIVFFGRFVALLRTWAALLAGANQMPWRQFFFFNAMGAVAWTTSVGVGGYAFGVSIDRVLGPFGIVLLIAVVVIGFTAVIYLRHHEKRLLAEADLALPGPRNVLPHS
jgi:membrane protein DedA with SNARE-associated domain